LVFHFDPDDDRLVKGKGQAKNSDKLFGRGESSCNQWEGLIFLLSLGGREFREGYFSGFPGSITLTIPHHLLTLTGALKGKGGGGANHELSHQATNTHLFIVVDICTSLRKPREGEGGSSPIKH
jgi:hypothetical protein